MFRNPTVGLAMAAVLAMQVAVPPAVGQEPERGVTVRERPRPDYDSIGLRAGGFLLFPSVEVGVRHDDNIYRTDAGETADWTVSVRPGIHAVSQWSNHELVLDAGAEADRFRENRNEDAADWFASAAGRLDVTRNTNARAGLGLERRHEDRGDPSSAASARPGSYTRGDASVEAFHRLNRLGLTARASVADLSWRAPSQRDRDRREIALGAQAGYRLGSGVEAFARATRIERKYERHQGDFDRNSAGWELVAGTELDLGGIVFGEAFAGVLRQGYEDPVLPTIEGLAVGGSLDWNVTPLTTVSGLVRRTVEESVLQASGSLATHAEVSVDHELLRNLILSANVSFTRNDYEAVGGGSGREDDVLGAGLGATWLIGRHVHVDVGYRFESRDSTVSGAGYDSNAVTLSLRFQL